MDINSNDDTADVPRKKTSCGINKCEFLKSEKREIGFECFLYVHHFEIQQECPIVPESHGYNFKNKKEYQKIKGNTKIMILLGVYS